MNNSAPFEGDRGASDPLDVLLREGAAEIPDGGFSARVVANLPKRSASRRMTFMLHAVLLAAAMLLSIWQLSDLTALLEALPRSTVSFHQLTTFLAPVSLLVLIAWRAFILGDEGA